MLDQFQGAYQVDDSHWIATFAFGHAGIPKLLRYNLTKLVQYGGVLSMRTMGTVFTMDWSITRNTLAMTFILAVTAVCTVFAAGEENIHQVETESLERLSSHINAFVPFALGLYVSLTLSRWWALRVQALGKVLDAMCNTVMLLSAELPGEEWKDLCE